MEVCKELVKKYINKADKIYAVAKNEEKLKELSLISQKIIPVVLDLADLEKVREFSFSLKDIDLVIANAAISLPHCKDFTPFEEFKKTFDINFLSIHALLEGIVPQMQQRKSGKIV